MMYMMNTANFNNLSAILAEDVNAPELRNPKVSGMRKAREKAFSRLVAMLNSKQ